VGGDLLIPHDQIRLPPGKHRLPPRDHLTQPGTQHTKVSHKSNIIDPIKLLIKHTCFGDGMLP